MHIFQENQYSKRLITSQTYSLIFGIEFIIINIYLIAIISMSRTISNEIKGNIQEDTLIYKIKKLMSKF